MSETNQCIASLAVVHSLEDGCMHINQLHWHVMDSHEGKDDSVWNELIIFVAVKLQSQMESPGETRARTSE
jgi:hypothetical protein